MALLCHPGQLLCREFLTLRIPTTAPSVSQDGKKGNMWQVPNSLTTHRDDVDKGGKMCMVRTWYCADGVGIGCSRHCI